MRVALISDLHGNQVGLRAVLDDAQRAKVDRVICLGDVATLGPRPREVLAMLRDAEIPCILGNHDEFLLDSELVRRYTDVPVVIEAVDWCRAQLDETELSFVRTFEARLEVELDVGCRLLLFHGSPRSHMENLLATMPPIELDAALDGRNAEVMAGGHTHIQMLRQHRGTLLVNPGSVGMPFLEYVSGREPRVLAHAEYAIVDARGGCTCIELRRVALDRAELRAAVAAVDWPMRRSLLAQYA